MAAVRIKRAGGPAAMDSRGPVGLRLRRMTAGRLPDGPDCRRTGMKKGKTFVDLAVGMQVSIENTVSEQDVVDFAACPATTTRCT